MTFLNFRFRIPFTVQNNRTEDVSKLQNEWVSLIERYCQLCKGASLSQEGSEGDTSSEADYENVTVALNEQKEEALYLGLSSATTDLNKPSNSWTKPAEGEAALASPSPLPISKAEVPPAPPVFPQPSSLSPLTKRTKAFHWDVVPCDKVRMKLIVAVKEREKKKEKSSLHYLYNNHKSTVVPQNNQDALLYVWVEQSSTVILSFSLSCHSYVFRFKNPSGNHVTHARKK